MTGLMPKLLFQFRICYLILEGIKMNRLIDLREERIKQLEERMRIVEEENLKYANIMEEYKELKDIFARLRDFYQKTGLKLYDNI